jgi:hypothetical protein
VARKIVLEVSAAQHRSKKVSALDDFLGERLIAERVILTSYILQSQNQF